MGKRPSFQFYPGDWRREQGLRLCSMAARGLWIEMMALMHDACPYGHLVLHGRAMTTEELARLVGDSAPAVKRWLRELENQYVLSRTSDGIIYSRRMVRDEEIVELRREGGREHGQKGAAHGKKGGRPRKEKTPSKTPSDNDARGFPETPPSSSSSSSSSYSDTVVSGAAAPLRPPNGTDKLLFDEGVAVLTAAGISISQARSVIGRWRSRHSDQTILDAVRAAARHPPAAPIEYITAILSGKAKANERDADDFSNATVKAAMERAAVRRGPGGGGG